MDEVQLFVYNQRRPLAAIYGPLKLILIFPYRSTIPFNTRQR